MFRQGYLAIVDFVEMCQVRRQACRSNESIYALESMKMLSWWLRLIDVVELEVDARERPIICTFEPVRTALQVTSLQVACQCRGWHSCARWGGRVLYAVPGD
jgi:hypothetical protein